MKAAAFELTGFRRRLPELAPLALLLVVPLALFRQALAGPSVVVGYDLVLYSYPYRAAVAAALQRGQFPFWNPDIFAGAPFFANIQSAVLYPVNWLFSWPGGPQMLAWSIIVNLAIGAFLFYAFGRRALGLGPAPALIGALAFAFSGFVLAQSEHLNQNAALPWMPGVILALDQAYRRRSLVWAGVLAICLGLQLLAGAPQEVYDTLVLGVLWTATLLWRSRTPGMRSAVTGLLWPVVGGATALLLTAIQLVPTAELTRYSVRSGGLPIDQAASFSLPLQNVLVNLLADYGTRLYNEYAGYIGLLATLLAGLAVVRMRRAPEVVALAAAAVTALLLALGQVTPLFQLAYHVVPGFSSFRVPARWLMVSTFAMAALAALGASELDALLRTRKDWKWTAPLMVGPELLVLFFVGFALQRLGITSPVLQAVSGTIRGRQLLIWLMLLLVAAIVLVTARRRGSAASPLLAVLVAVELFLAAQPLAPLETLPASIYAPDGLTSSLPADTGPYRSLSLAGSSLVGLPVSGYGSFATRRAVDEPNIGMARGRASVDGYDGGILPLASYARFRSLLLPVGSANPPDYPLIMLTVQVPPPALLNLLNVRTMVATDDRVAGDAALSDYRVIGRQHGFTLLENQAALPRAFLVHQVSAVTSETAALAAVGSSSFAPDKMGVSLHAGCYVSPAHAPDQVDIFKNEHEHLVLRTASEGAGLLVVANTDYPGWQATIDGRAAAIHQVDALVQGVCLPAGAHTVSLNYVPNRWALGVTLSSIGLMILLGLLLFEPLRRLRLR